MGLSGSLDVLVGLARGVRVRAAGRVGAADFLAAVVGQVEVVFHSVGLRHALLATRLGWTAETSKTWYEASFGGWTPRAANAAPSNFS